MKVEVTLHRLRCEATTERGEDEVYILVAGQDPNGNPFHFRLPSPDGDWDLNDGGDAQEVGGIAIWAGDVPSRRSVNLSAIVMEHDDSKAIEAARLAVRAARETKPEGLVGTLLDIAAAILELMTNTDDFPGAVGVRIRPNVTGGLDVEHRAVQRSKFLGVSNDIYSFELNGDGSRYFLDLRVKGTTFAFPYTAIRDTNWISLSGSRSGPVAKGEVVYVNQKPSDLATRMTVRVRERVALVPVYDFVEGIRQLTQVDIEAYDQLRSFKRQRLLSAPTADRQPQAPGKLKKKRRQRK